MTFIPREIRLAERTVGCAVHVTARRHEISKIQPNVDKSRKFIWHLIRTTKHLQVKASALEGQIQYYGREEI